MPIVIEFFVKDEPKLDSPCGLVVPLWVLVLETRTELPLKCSEKV